MKKVNSSLYACFCVFSAVLCCVLSLVPLQLETSPARHCGPGWCAACLPLISQLLCVPAVTFYCQSHISTYPDPTYVCDISRWSNQAKQEFTQGTHDHLTVQGVDCEDLIQEGLETLMQEVNSWVEHLRQDKVLASDYVVATAHQSKQIAQTGDGKL